MIKFTRKGFNYYVTNLDWDDGSPLEFVETPNEFDRLETFNHTYSKPGFYSIKGLVFKNAYELIDVFPKTYTALQSAHVSSSDMTTHFMTVQRGRTQGEADEGYAVHPLGTPENIYQSTTNGVASSGFQDLTQGTRYTVYSQQPLGQALSGMGIDTSKWAFENSSGPDVGYHDDNFYPGISIVAPYRSFSNIVLVDRIGTVPEGDQYTERIINSETDNPYKLLIDQSYNFPGPNYYDSFKGSVEVQVPGYNENGLYKVQASSQPYGGDPITGSYSQKTRTKDGGCVINLNAFMDVKKNDYLKYEAKVWLPNWIRQDGTYVILTPVEKPPSLYTSNIPSTPPEGYLYPNETNAAKLEQLYDATNFVYSSEPEYRTISSSFDNAIYVDEEGNEVFPPHPATQLPPGFPREPHTDMGISGPATRPDTVRHDLGLYTTQANVNARGVFWLKEGDTSALGEITDATGPNNKRGNKPNPFSDNTRDIIPALGGAGAWKITQKTGNNFDNPRYAWGVNWDWETNSMTYGNETDDPNGMKYTSERPLQLGGYDGMGGVVDTEGIIGEPFVRYAGFNLKEGTYSSDQQWIWGGATENNQAQWTRNPFYAAGTLNENVNEEGQGAGHWRWNGADWELNPDFAEVGPNGEQFRLPTKNPTQYVSTIRAHPATLDAEGAPILTQPNYSERQQKSEILFGTNSWQTIKGELYAASDTPLVRIMLFIRQRDFTKDYRPNPEDAIWDWNLNPPDLNETEGLQNYNRQLPWTFYVKDIKFMYKNTNDVLFPLEWERFRSNVVVNQSRNYKSPFLDFNNESFLMIGGFSKNSYHYKTLYSLLGLGKDSSVLTQKYNLYDVIKANECLAKYDHHNYNLTLLNPYSDEIFDADGELIHSGFVDKENNGVYENTSIEDIDVSTARVFKGVVPMWKQLGFQNDSFDIPDNFDYWNNIIPKNYGLENRVGITRETLHPLSGSTIPRMERETIVIDEDASQDWLDGYRYPNLPKFDRFGNLVSEVDITSVYGSDALDIITNINYAGGDLVLNMNLNADEQIEDLTARHKINLTKDFSLSLDDNDRIIEDIEDQTDQIETDQDKQAF